MGVESCSGRNVMGSVAGAGVDGAVREVNLVATPLTK